MTRELESDIELRKYFAVWQFLEYKKKGKVQILKVTLNVDFSSFTHVSGFQ